MDELRLPPSPNKLAGRLRVLHERRKKLSRPARRLSLTAKERAAVLDKTGTRCHLCGGRVRKGNPFAADHVLAHAAGGKHALDNYLAAHGLCNGCRWFYSPEEFKWILRMGIWARKQMEDKNTRIGLDMLPAFWKHEKASRKRRKV
jgi:HNH endonuclease